VSNVIVDTVILFCVAASIAGRLLCPAEYGPYPELAKASALAFFATGILVWYRSRWVYGLGFLAGLLSGYWFVATERLPDYWTTWVLLNQPGSLPSDAWWLPFYWIFRVLSAPLIVLATVLCLLRLFRVRKRIWPAALAAAVSTSVWFFACAMPYHVPMFDHSSQPDFRLLYVQKRALGFQETTFHVYRNWRVWVILQYQFRSRVSETVLDEAAHRQAQAFVAAQLWRQRTPVPGPLRARNADGWYAS